MSNVHWFTKANTILKDSASDSIIQVEILDSSSCKLPIIVKSKMVDIGHVCLTYFSYEY